MQAESVYARLPVVFQNLACDFEGWRVERERFGRGFASLQAAIDSRPHLGIDAMAAFRDERLRAFVAHAVATVPYYATLFRDRGLEADEIRTLGDLRELPVLTKEHVRSRLSSLVSSTIPPRQRMLIHTSGTSGGGLRFYRTRRAVQEQWATYWRYWRWHGIQRGTPCAFFGGRSVVPVEQDRPPYWRASRPQQRVLFSAHHMSPQNLGSYAHELRRFRPPWIHGYPSLIALLASHIVESGFDLGYAARWVTTGAENLTPHQREVITKAFGVCPRQHYGSTEAVAQFSECELGTLHVDEDFAAVEIVDDDDGQPRVVGTNLTNLATPLLRYDVGDVASISSKLCPCGKPGRTVERLDGRLEDYVVLPNGARVAALNHIFKDMVRIREAQLHQRTAGEVTIKVVPTTAYTDADEGRLLEEARKRLGSDTAIEIERVASLPRTRNGKLSLVVSEMVKP